MLGPYTANDDGTISYRGNKVFKPIKNILAASAPIKEFEKRVEQFDNAEMWQHIARINHQINMSANEFFNGIGFGVAPLVAGVVASLDAGLNFAMNGLLVTLFCLLLFIASTRAAARRKGASKG